MAGRYEDRILRVIAHIHDHPAGDLSLDALAEVAAMSRFHWHRVFRAVTGETCAQAVRRVRLNRAAFWLVHTDWPVAEVGARAGYPAAASFARAFAEAYGTPPAAFRARGALLPPLAATGPGERPVHPIEIETLPARRLAAIPHRGAYPEIGRAFEALGSVLGARNLWGQTRGMVGVYYDDPTATEAADLRSHAGAIVPDDLGLEAPLEKVRLRAGRYAVMRFRGPYSGLQTAYDHLYGTWLPQSGEEVGDHPPIELYLDGPNDTSPEELRTDVCLPLAGA